MADLLLLAAAAGGAYYWFVVRKPPAAAPSTASSGTAAPAPTVLPDFRQYNSVDDLKADWSRVREKLGTSTQISGHDVRFTDKNLQNWNKFQQKFNEYTLQEQPQLVSQMNEMSPGELMSLLMSEGEDVGNKLGFQGAFVQHVKDYYKNILIPEAKMQQQQTMGVDENQQSDLVDT